MRKGKTSSLVDMAIYFGQKWWILSGISKLYQRLILELIQIKRSLQMKLALLCVFLAVVQLGTAGTLVSTQNYAVTYGPRVVFSTPAPRLIVLDPFSCSTEVDQYVRSQYWYYLPSADLCYVAHINHQGGLLYVHQYKNYIGTFMSISKYANPSRNITVVTFVRLGEGYQSIANLYEPIYLRPFTVSMNLGWGHYQVPQFRQNDVYDWTESWAQNQFYRSRVAAVAAANKCTALDHTARTTYSHYLKGAVILSEANAEFQGKGCYCQNTYVNIQGTWLVIGSYNSAGRMSIDTFVRLGDGYDPSNVQKCIPFPSITSWSS